MMELKRLLTRATALLLQGAYQGAESFIEQAMAEADKIKKELAELDTLRTRVTEMAAEVERLQSVIDEANAQEPVCKIIRNEAGQVSIKNGEGDYFDMSKYVGFSLYARPIPAQQSFEQALRLLADSRENFENQFGFSSDADWVYKDLAELFIVDLPVQQSPAVAVPETISDQLENFICYLIDKEEGAIIAEETLHHQLAAFLSNEKYNKPSPRITEQDALQKLRTEVGEAINILAMCGDKTPFDQLGKKLVAAFNDSSSPKLNEAKHD